MRRRQLRLCVGGRGHRLRTLISESGPGDAVTEIDAAVLNHLRGAGSTLSAEALEALIAGVAAAPAAHETDGWMVLLGDGVDPRLIPPLIKARLNERVAVAREGSAPAATAAAAEKLDALRGEMRRRRLAGMVVPKTDEHQSEYLAARAERLAWLTGFTGSAGTAVVLRRRAALFVDGRYSLQAAAQVDPALFEVHRVGGDTMSEWIAANAGVGTRLGYDPWLHSSSQADVLRAACERGEARLVTVADNPIDAIWTDRPPPPLAPVVGHDETFAGASAEVKHGQIVAVLSEAKQDAAVIAAPDSICWLLNLRGGDVPFAPLMLAFAVVHAEGPVEVFVDPRKPVAEVRARLEALVRFCPPEAFEAALERLGAERKRVRVDGDGVPEAVASRLRRAGAKVSLAADPCLSPKATKNAVELAGIRAAHRRDGAAVCRFLAWLADEMANGGGVSELSASARLAVFRGQGARYRGPSFPTIAGAAANGAIVHYRADATSNRPLRPGSLFLVDSGGQYLDGTTDITRTLAIGEPTAEMRHCFTLVLKGHIAVATARFPRGTTGSQLDVLARRALWADGLDYDHGTGHGVGHYLCVHEGPQRISKMPSRVALEPGMVVSNEPGFYRTAAYGIRIENLVAVVPLNAETEGGDRPGFLAFETLSLAPIDRTLIDATLLDAGERAWLDAYHARVADTLTPLVDAEVAAWLRAATRPIAG